VTITIVTDYPFATLSDIQSLMSRVHSDAVDPLSSPARSPRTPRNDDDVHPNDAGSDDVEELGTLFEGLRFYLSPSLRTYVSRVLGEILRRNGGEEIFPSPAPQEDDLDAHLANEVAQSREAREVKMLRRAHYIISDSWHLERDVLLADEGKRKASTSGMDVDQGRAAPHIVTVCLGLEGICWRISDWGWL
jgi:hypothetical protein